MTSRQLRTIQELIESRGERDERQHAEITRAFERASVDRSRDARQERKQFEEMKAEVTDLGWALEEAGEAAREGFLRLDHHLDRVQGELAAAWDGVRRLLEEGPRAKAAREYRERGERAYSNGWVDDALEDFHKAEAENYEDFAVYFQLADLYAELGEDAKAIEYYEKTAKYARPYLVDVAAEALLAAAGLRERQGDFEGAYKYASDARQLNPQGRKIARRVAYVCARLAARTGRTSEALSALRRLFEIAPGTSLWVPGKPAFASIQPQIRELLQELLKRAEARANALLESIAAAKTALGRLQGVAETESTKRIDASCARIREELGAREYVNACEARELARKVCGEAWTAVIEACERHLESLGAEERAAGEKVVEGRERATAAMRGHVGRGVWVFLGVWFGLAIPALAVVGVSVALRAVSSGNFVTLWGAADLAALVIGIAAGIMATRRARLKDRRRCLEEVQRWEEERTKLLERASAMQAEREAAMARLKESGAPSPAG